ncbi:SH3 domain-containing protein [Ruminococcus callidus]|uniref:SH3 domain-containing protein n=1 Tax=Ruminococcus callidus TaxID=40519 RepID=UPI002676571C|nr:SH3 domain-containing protein [uncultured Ruminococcus sp.]
MRKKIMAVVLSCLTIFALVASSFAVTFSASAVSVDEMTKAAVQIISRSEGTYGTINPNDNGAVSIGMLQWHADRALQLMRSIANADTGSAQSILGSSFYNDVMNASNWNSRTFSSAESTAASNLLTTAAGKSKQDALAYSDVQGYISAGQNLGISNAGVLVYYAELYNRGMGVAKRILNAAAGGGSYSNVTLSKLHTTALANSSSYYTDRLNNAYNTIVSLGWGDASVSGGGDNGSGGGSVDTSDFSESYAGTYTVTASSLNVRSTPSTSGAKVGVLPNGAQVTVTSANGSWAAVSYNGISGYCSMDYLKQNAAQTTAPAETTAPAQTTTTAATAATSDFSESYAGTYSVNASSLNIRSAPTTSASKVGSIPNGTQVTVTSGNGKWAAVSYNGISGYCSMDYLKQAAAQTTTTEETTAPAETTTTTAETTTTTASQQDTEPAETTPIDMNRVDEAYVSLYGDVNCDGTIDILDAVLLQKYLNGSVQLNYTQLANSDCQKDSQLDITDVTVLMQYLLRSFTSLPVA